MSLIYQPAEDSYLLASCVKKYSNGKKVLDMGSGSGIQALTALSSNASSVLAVDVNEEAVASLKKIGINARISNFFSSVKESFDLIVFNPPYLPMDKFEDKESARITSGGKKGDEIILRFLKEAPSHLLKNGCILLLVSSLTPMKRINSLLRKVGFSFEIIASQKIFMEELSVLKISFKGKR